MTKFAAYVSMLRDRSNETLAACIAIGAL